MKTLIESILGKWGEGSTKNGALIVALAAFFFPDMDWNMVAALVQDWWDLTVALGEVVNIDKIWGHLSALGIGGYFIAKKEKNEAA